MQSLDVKISYSGQLNAKDHGAQKFRSIHGIQLYVSETVVRNAGRALSTSASKSRPNCQKTERTGVLFSLWFNACFTTLPSLVQDRPCVRVIDSEVIAIHSGGDCCPHSI